MSSIYDSPKSKLEERNRSDYKLFKVSGVGVATFFGSILAGGIVMSMNYMRLGENDAAKKALIYSALATLAVFGIIFLIPADINIPNTALTVPQVIAMVQIAKKNQQQSIDDHISGGGQVSSNWKAFGIGLLTIIPIVVVVFAVTLVFI